MALKVNYQSLVKFSLHLSLKNNQMKTKQKNSIRHWQYILVWFALLSCSHQINAQEVLWNRVAPASDAINTNENLFVSLSINDGYSFDVHNLQVLLDQQPVVVLM